MRTSIKQTISYLCVGAVFAIGPVDAAEKEVIVVNTPDVKVANMPDVNVVNVPDVIVANLPDNPVSVTVVDQTAPRQPYQETKFVQSPSTFGRNVFGPISAGKRLLIEYVSASLQIERGGGAYCYIGIVQPGNPARQVMEHELVVHRMGGGLAVDRYSVSTPITLFVDAGQEIWFDCVWQPSQPGSTIFSASVSGLLTDL